MAGERTAATEQTDVDSLVVGTPSLFRWTNLFIFISVFQYVLIHQEISRVYVYLVPLLQVDVQQSAVSAVAQTPTFAVLGASRYISSYPYKSKDPVKPGLLHP